MWSILHWIFLYRINPNPVMHIIASLTLSAISYINKSTYESCFEWGSGGSTLFLAKKCKRITTIENDIQWHNKLKKELKKPF